MKLSRLLFVQLTNFALSVVANCDSNSYLQYANETNTYDYIVTGSGPGGGTIATNLARAGYSVLLIEAGDDQSSAITTQILSLFSRDTPTRWDFFVRHSDDIERTKRYNLLTWRLKNGKYFVGKPAELPKGEEDAKMLGVYYPRGATLGGSAIVNAAATWLPSDSDWDYFSKGTGDGIWSGKEMREIFKRIEHNNYLSPGAPGHGFGGWLQTNVADRSLYGASNLRLSIIKAGAKLLGLDPSKLVDYLVADGNYEDPNRDVTEGIWALPFHVTKTWKRFSPRDYILATRAEKNSDGSPKFKLDLQLSSLATKVLFEKGTCAGEDGKPKAVGVEWLEGTAVYKGDSRWNGTQVGKPGRAFAKKEVIVSGGTFNTPQLLQLSGIGPANLLKKFNISVISDLPGVGRNLQDNQELPIVGHAKVSLLPPPDPNAPNCTSGAPGDICVELWKNGTGPYAQGGDNAFAVMRKTKFAVEGERDMLIFNSGAFILRGFTPPNAVLPVTDPPSVFGWSTVKMHPQNGAGVIQIKSSDPRDTPDINFNHFVEGAETDIGAILDTVAWGRRAFATTEDPFGPVTPIEPPCPPTEIGEDGRCRNPETDKRWVEDQIFGHHPTSTCSVGGNDNPLAVLDTRLRVRGVNRLRVVDASAFPRCPGAFPAVATYMLSEKATDLVLEDAKVF